MGTNEVNRLEQVARLPRPMDDAKCRSDADALEYLRKAIFASKGKCNTRNAWFIAKFKDSTIEDILRFGVPDSYWGSDKAIPSKSHIKKSAWQKDQEFLAGKITRVRDSIVRKFLESKGLWDEETDNRYGNLDNDNWIKGGWSECQKLKRLLTYAKYIDDEGEFSKRCQNTMRYWMENISLDIHNDSEISRFRKEMFDKELDWLNNAPDEVLATIAEKERHNTQNFTQAVFNSGLVNCNHDTEKGYELIELCRGFIEVLEHMGIGIADTQTEPHTSSLAQIRIGIKQLMKKAITLSKTFVKLVKQGFEPELARDEVIEQLNQFVITNKSKVHWAFYARKDAPKSYEYQKTAKPAKSSGTKTTSKASLKVDDDGYLELPGIGRVKVR